MNLIYDNLFDLLTGVSDNTSKLRAELELDENSCVIAFRGESQDYKDTKLLPSMYRVNMSTRDEKNFFELLRDYNIIDLDNKSFIEKAIEAQHYLQTSRLLDISFNALIAIYFATHQNGNDGKLYLFCFPNCFSPSSSYIENYYNSMLNEQNNNLILSNNFKVITHGFYNNRMKLQSGGFVFFPSENISPIPSCFYRTLTIPAEAKDSIRRDLVKFFSLYESTVFPEKEKRKEIIMESMKRNRLEILDEKPKNVLFEINTFFELLTFEIKIDIKEIKETFQEINKAAINNGLDMSIKKIYRKIRKARMEIEQGLNAIDKNLLEKYSELIKFNFEGLNILCNKLEENYDFSRNG